MATTLKGVSLEPSHLLNILQSARDWAVSHGIVLGTGAGSHGENQVRVCPFTLFPSPVPRPLMEQALSTMPLFSSLMHRVSSSHHFLQQALHRVVMVDAFTNKLWELYETVREEGFAQPLSLGLFRNDFMMDCKEVEKGSDVDTILSPRLRLRQVEFNTIAVGGSGKASALVPLHRYTMSMSGFPYEDGQIPDNDPVLGQARGLQKAFQAYTDMFKVPKKQCAILYVVCPNERNFIDQRLVEFSVFEVDKNIRVLRRCLHDVSARAHLRNDKSLWLDGKEIAVAYYRAGYSPDHYPTDKEWSARLMVERSRAVKCPSIQLQLAGTKKVQQELARPGALERFCQEPAVLRDTFALQHSLDQGTEGDGAIDLAMASPTEYVLKPQREGGGNNLYGLQMTARLQEIRDTPERDCYILMERIKPLPQKNFLVKDAASAEVTDIVSEIGIYGAYLGSDDAEYWNEVCGSYLRTRPMDTDEGGVMAGIGGIDTAFLV